MGHRRDAVEALRAYARDLDSTIPDGAGVRVGSAHQDDAGVINSGFGAPHHGLIVGAVGVVLVGIVGVWAMSGHPGTTDTAAPATVAVAATTPRASGPAGNTAFGVRAVARFSSLGLQAAADAVTHALDSGLDQDAAVVDAMTRLWDLTQAYQADEDPTQDPAVVAAVEALIEVTTAPGLDPTRTPPGQGGTPPGRDDTFTPPGRDDTFTPPGRDDTFTPPGRDDTFIPPGRTGGNGDPGSVRAP